MAQGLYTIIRNLIHRNIESVPKDFIDKYSGPHVPPKHVQKRDLRAIRLYIQ